MPACAFGGCQAASEKASSAPTDGAVRIRPEAARPNVQDVAGEYRQHRHGAAEQDREQVERHAAEQDPRPTDEAQAAARLSRRLSPGLDHGMGLGEISRIAPTLTSRISARQRTSLSRRPLRTAGRRRPDR